jgi:hypothetical protein
MEMTQELIGLAMDVRVSAARGEELGLSAEDIAFYDALAENDSAVSWPTISLFINWIPRRESLDRRGSRPGETLIGCTGRPGDNRRPLPGSGVQSWNT